MSRISCLTALFLSFTYTAMASEHKDAKEIFDEAACMRCHSINHFRVKKERVNSFEKLQKSVQRCASNTHAGWFEEDIYGVSRFLNHEYYKMPQPPAMEE